MAASPLDQQDARIDETSKATPAESQKAPFPKSLVTLHLVLLGIACIFLRCWQLDNIPGLNADEAWHGVKAYQAAHGEAKLWQRDIWVTPTGNHANLFFVAPEIMLHRWFSPSSALLRLPALCSGLLLLAVNYYLCSGVFDRRTAIISTAMFAVLPVSIAYSRFAWQTCQTMLVSLPAVYCAAVTVDSRHVLRCMGGAVLAMFAAVIVHPTNIFLAPLLATPFLIRWRRPLSEALLFRRRKSHSLIVYLAALLLLSAVAWFQSPRLIETASRVARPGEIVVFIICTARLFSGVTVYQFISGALLSDPHNPSPAALKVFDIFGLILVLATIAMTAAMLRQPDRRRELVTIGGLQLSMLAFYLVVGPQGVSPHNERYGLWLIAPCVVLGSRAAAWAIQRRPKTASLALATVAWVVLAGFYLNYFSFIHRTGGNSHRTFQTAETDPKAEAVQYVVRQSPGEEPVWIVTDESWSYWPLKYFALPHSNLRVLMADEFERGQGEAIQSGRVWIVEYAGKHPRQETSPQAEHVVADYSQQPALHIRRMQLD